MVSWYSAKIHTFRAYNRLLNSHFLHPYFQYTSQCLSFQEYTRTYIPYIYAVTPHHKCKRTRCFFIFSINFGTDGIPNINVPAIKNIPFHSIFFACVFCFVCIFRWVFGSYLNRVIYVYYLSKCSGNFCFGHFCCSRYTDSMLTNQQHHPHQLYTVFQCTNKSKHSF